MARRELGPATLAVVQAVATALSPSERSLLVACSGGPDSLALAAGAAHVAARSGRTYAAAVVDHGLQAGSAAVAVGASKQLAGLGFVDVAVLHVEVVDAGDGPEASARAARYTALEAERASRGATLLLGHTRDDQAESVLLGLARGSGARSLAGMPGRSGRGLRPLLGLPRTTTLACCSELGLSPWSDPQNADPAYARARVRARVLPVLETELGPGVTDALARTADLLRADADLLDTLAADARGPVEDSGGLDCAGLAALPTALRTRVLLAWLRDVGARDVTTAHVVAVDALVTGWHGQGAVDVSGAHVVREEGSLRAQI